MDSSGLEKLYLRNARGSLIGYGFQYLISVVAPELTSEYNYCLDSGTHILCECTCRA